jgi:hypothetical protein
MYKKTLLFIAGAILVATPLINNAMADGQTESASIDVSATVILPIGLADGTAVEFSTLISGTTWTLDHGDAVTSTDMATPASSAPATGTFTTSGEENELVTYDFDNLTLDHNGTETDTLTFVPELIDAGEQTLDTNAGTALKIGEITVGGEIEVGAVASGTYSGSFTVGVSYD